MNLTFPAGIYLFKVNNVKDQNNVSNLFNVNNKDTGTMSMKGFIAMLVSLSG